VITIYENLASNTLYATTTFSTPTSYIEIGDQSWPGYGGAISEVMNGSISNVQIYNASLSQAEIAALYDEGIGGAPIDLQNLVGWWPLNGNANDYSGNDNNGVPSGVTYTSNWYSGYSAP